GVADPASTALLALLAGPQKLVACEIEPDGVPALSGFIAGRKLHEVVRPFFGVDQADRQLVAAIVDGEIAPGSIDLVIDDASHLYEPSLATFEVLLPRLRCGGTYLIEDWPAGYRYAVGLRDAIEDTASPSHASLK